jgi:hypothetical protein
LKRPARGPLWVAMRTASLLGGIMKRTAATIALLAGFGGGCMSTDGPNAKKPAPSGGFNTVTNPMTAKGLQGPTGEPIPLAAARGAMPTGSSGVPATMMAASGLQPAGGKNTMLVRGYVPGISTVDPRVIQANDWQGGPPQGGILPVPGMGPPGAVAAFGAMNTMAMRMAPSNQRTSIRFTGPAGMKITWQLPNGGFNDEASGLTAPTAYNFLQSQVYRLRLSQILPNFPGRTFYPTLEVTPMTPKTLTYLAHSAVPVTFADEDFRQAADGNLVVKVIYLPDPAFQDFAALGGADEIVSTRLEPGADPVAEAQKRGTILAIIRLGNIDLENRASPAMTAPPPGVMIGGPPPVMAMPPLGGPPKLTAPPPMAKPMPPGKLPGNVKSADDDKPIILPPIK